MAEYIKIIYDRILSGKVKYFKTIYLTDPIVVGLDYSGYYLVGHKEVEKLLLKHTTTTIKYPW